MPWFSYSINPPTNPSPATSSNLLHLVYLAFAKVVPEQLYSEVIVIPDAASIERLRLICEHPTYSKLLLSGPNTGKTGQTGHFLSIQEVFGLPARATS